MAPRNGWSWRLPQVLAKVWLEPCMISMGTCVGKILLWWHLEEVTPQLAGPSGTYPGRFSPVGTEARAAVTVLLMAKC